MKLKTRSLVYRDSLKRHRTPSRNSSGKSDPPLCPVQPKWSANLIALWQLCHYVPPGLCQNWDQAAGSQDSGKYFSAGSPQPLQVGHLAEWLLKLPSKGSSLEAFAAVAICIIALPLQCLFFFSSKINLHIKLI